MLKELRPQGIELLKCTERVIKGTKILTEIERMLQGQEPDRGNRNTQKEHKITAIIRTIKATKVNEQIGLH